MNYKKGLKIILDEMMTASGGVFGPASTTGHGGSVGNVDFYAPGDARNLWGSFPSTQDRKKKKKKQKTKSKKSEESKIIAPLYRRNFMESLESEETQILDSICVVKRITNVDVIEKVLEEAGIEPTIYIAPGDIEQKSGWGDEKYLQHRPSGSVLQGNQITKQQLPPVLWHVTTNAPAVQQSGVLRGDVGQLGGLGKGTSAKHQGVSLTTDRNDALLIKRELLRKAELARGRDIHEALPAYAEEDVRFAGADPEGIMKAVAAGLQQYEAQKEIAVNKDTWDESKSLNSAIEAHQMYLISRESHANVEDPVIFGRAKDFAHITPEMVDIVAVKPEDIPEGALIIDDPMGHKFMHEVMVHADIPIDKSYFVRQRIKTESVVFEFSATDDKMREVADKLQKILYREIESEDFVMLIGEFTDDE